MPLATLEVFISHPTSFAHRHPGGSQAGYTVAMDRPSFRTWLLAQRTRRDPIGDLAQDVARDESLKGKRLTPTGLFRHIRLRTSYTPVLDAVMEAGREFGQPVRARGV